jgi:putative protease
MKKKRKITKVKRKAVKNKVVKKKKVSGKVKRKCVRKQKIEAQKAKSPISSSIPAGASLEEVGAVTHYFPHVEAAVIKLTKGPINVGDSIIIKGHTTDFKDKVASMQLDHVPITNATLGQEIGLRVKSKVREHDVVYKIVS